MQINIFAIVFFLLLACWDDWDKEVEELLTCQTLKEIYRDCSVMLNE